MARMAGRAAMPHKQRKPLTWPVGARVEARVKLNKHSLGPNPDYVYYAGTVAGHSPPSHPGFDYAIAYDDGDVEPPVDERDLREPELHLFRPTLMQRVFARWDDKWHEAVVQADDNTLQPPSYKVEFTYDKAISPWLPLVTHIREISRRSTKRTNTDEKPTRTSYRIAK